MSTTAVAIEMVIIGFQALIWISLMVLNIFGLRLINSIPSTIVRDWAAIISLGLIGIAYTLGILWDLFLRNFTMPTRVEIDPREGPVGENTITFIDAQAFIIVNNKEAYEELTKITNRLSLIRASLINFLIIGITSIQFAFRYFIERWQSVAVISFFTLVFLYLTIKVWGITAYNYEKSLSLIYSHTQYKVLNSRSLNKVKG